MAAFWATWLPLLEGRLEQFSVYITHAPLTDCEPNLEPEPSVFSV